MSVPALEALEKRVLEAKTLETIRWTLETYPDLLMTSGFNLNGTVLVDLAVRAGFRGELVFIDTLSHFPETLRTRDDVDGERSVALRRAARFGDQAARDMLLRYNEDDCRATRAVRDFLAAGAPGVPEFGAV